MARLKLNLPTGAVAEKPIVTCFEVDNKSYLILDAENVGSMGLPIILVCKIDNNRVVKITDASEWQQAKDYLKGIIAGNTMNYVSVAPEMSADELYFTQLTLPVASFDVIKNNYKVEEVNTEVVESTPVAEPVIPEETPVEAAPVIDITVAPEPVKSEEPVMDPVIPISEETTNSENVDFSETKEAFMKACENMFDALVTKFQAELDSKK